MTGSLAPVHNPLDFCPTSSLSVCGAATSQCVLPSSRERHEPCNNNQHKQNNITLGKSHPSPAFGPLLAASAALANRVPGMRVGWGAPCVSRGSPSHRARIQSPAAKEAARRKLLWWGGKVHEGSSSNRQWENRLACPMGKEELES